MGKIFKDEEEARRVIKDNVRIPHDYDIPYDIREKINIIIFNMFKDLGYIKKSSLEETREDYEVFKNECKKRGEAILVDYANYITELEKENEKLRNL